jgi:hypothetical protein
MKAMKIIQIIFLLSFCSCATVYIPANHLMTPVVQEKQWSGEVNGLSPSMSAITVINDITTNPPTRTGVRVEPLTSLIPTINLHLTLFPHLEFVAENDYLFGLKWQFLGSSESPWAAATQVATGTRTDQNSSNTTSSRSSSNTRSTEAGLSFGYQAEFIMPYMSLIYEDHQTATLVQNPGGSFSYTDHGVHRNASLGLAKTSLGFSAAVEISYVEASWDRGTLTSQTSAGFSFGYRW